MLEPGCCSERAGSGSAQVPGRRPAEARDWENRVPTAASTSRFSPAAANGTGHECRLAAEMGQRDLKRRAGSSRP